MTRIDNTRDGYVVSVVMTENVRHYAYNDPEWQQAAAAYAEQHVVKSLRAGLEPDRASIVQVRKLAVTAVKPLNTNSREQSAKGLTAHFLVKGVAFRPDADADGMEDETTVQPQPISLRAEILDGGVTPDGMSPTASVGDIKIRLGGGGDYRVKQGLWYAPALVQKSRAETAAAAGAGKAPAAATTALPGRATVRRRVTRNAARWQHRRVPRSTVSAAASSSTARGTTATGLARSRRVSAARR